MLIWEILALQCLWPDFHFRYAKGYFFHSLVVLLIIFTILKHLYLCGTSLLPGCKVYRVIEWYFSASRTSQKLPHDVVKLKSTSLKEFWNRDNVHTLHVTPVEKCENISWFICWDSACCHSSLCTHIPFFIFLKDFTR